MAFLRGALVGDSQLKFLCSSRLRLSPLVRTCTFSFSGHDAISLAEMIRETRFRHADFVVLYVGGNDLDRADDPREIASHIKDLVLLLQENVASVVLVFKVLPRHFDEPRKAQFEDRRRRQLNRRLSATLKRLSGVHILNPEHRFLDASGKPMLSLFAADRYHVARDRGIDQMSKIIVAALVKIYGPGIASASRARPGEVYVVHRCRRCGAKGHKTDHCWAYCSPRRHAAAGRG
ncbi:uncharacterized protein LOC144097355 [Amblyomma americanum]